MLKEISIEESKKIQVEILEYIDTLCKKNNINYSLAYGSLLGAVRHQGFIPWDDDVDIMLLREDYDRLIEIFKDNKEYNLIYEKTKNNYFLYAKLCDKRTFLREKNYPYIETLGVFIDIFPMDNIPNNAFIRFLHGKILYFFDRLIYTSVLKIYFNSTSVFKTIIKFILFTPLALIAKPIGKEKLIQTTLRLMQKYKNKKTSHVGFFPNKYAQREFIPRDFFDSMSTYPFENKNFTGISNYDMYLKIVYNKYMELPPEEKRVSNHVFTAYWRDNS